MGVSSCPTAESFTSRVGGMLGISCPMGFSCRAWISPKKLIIDKMEFNSPENKGNVVCQLFQ